MAAVCGHLFSVFVEKKAIKSPFAVIDVYTRYVVGWKYCPKNHYRHKAVHHTMI